MAMKTVEHKFISTDSHLIVADNNAFRPLQKIYGDRAPHVVRKDDVDYLYLDGLSLYDLSAEGPWLTNKVAGCPAPSKGPARNLDDAHFGTFTPKGRIQQQDEDNIAAEMMYGGAFGLVAQQTPDEEYRTSCAQFWNDYAAEFCAHDPERLLAHAMLPLGESIDSSVVELERAKQMGFRSVMLPESEEWRMFQTDYWDPLFEAMNDLEVIGGIHVATNTRHENDFVKKQKKNGMFYTLAQHHSFIETAADLIFSGKLCRFPNLRIVLAEGGLGWLADSVNFLDTLFQEYPEAAVGLIPEGDKPSDVFFRHFYVTFQYDPVGLACKDFVDLSRVMWASDYPHCEGTFPESKSTIERMFTEYLTTDEILSVTRDNAANLYGIPV